MHGSLLPKYRGRVPINWAVLHGETETGATLHEMAAKPDAGAIIAQTSVPILPDDTAYEVFGKVVVAAEQTLWNVLPAMLAGKTPKLPNDISKGSYFGGRKPEDGRIDWSQPAQAVYNLHRAVAPPYPGAWTVVNGKTFVIGKARISALPKSDLPQGLAVIDNCIVGVGGDGHAIMIHQLLTDGKAISPIELQKIL
jgi:methionyl-tRNA formyltransferase